MDLRRRLSRLSSRVHRTPSSLSRSSSHTRSQGLGKEVCPHRGSKKIAQKRSNSADSQRGSDRLLFNLFLDNQEIGPVAPNTEPKTFEQIHASSTFSHGDLSQGRRSSSAGELGSYSRPSRRLSPCANSHELTEVVTLQHSEQGVQVCSSPLRSVNCSTHFYQSGEGSGRVSETPRDHNFCLSGRLADSGSKSRSFGSDNRNSLSVNKVSRFPHQSREVGTGTLSEASVSGIGTRSPAGKGVSHGREDLEDGVMCSSSKQVEGSRGSSPSTPVRVDGQSGRQCTAVQTAHEGTSDLPLGPVSSMASPSDSLASGAPQANTSSRMVVSSFQPEDWDGVPSKHSINDLNHRRIQARMGCSLSGAQDVRSLDSNPSSISYKHSGAMGSPSGPPSGDPEGERQDHQSKVRQYDCGSVHKQTGGHQELQSVQSNSETAHLVRSSPNNSCSRAYPRCRQYPGRSLVSQSNAESKTPKTKAPGNVGGVVSPSGSLSLNIQPYGSSPRRSVCVSDKSSPSSVLLMGGGSGSRRKGRHDHGLGGTNRLCLPPNRHNTEGVRKGVKNKRFSDPSGRPSVASSILVPPINKSTGSGTSTPPIEKGSFDHPINQRESPVDVHTDSALDSMDHLLRSFKEAGLSKEAADLASASRRDSTRRSYNSRLVRYNKWCGNREINPHTASLSEVSQFLTEVFQGGVMPRTVRAYRTAIAAIHHGFGQGMTVSNSPVLSSLVKGAFHQRPPKQDLVPEWDLSLVLQYLASDVFEPPHRISLLDLSRKTAFLVSLACGRRISEIHALSIDVNHTTFSSGGVTLLPRVGFLAKNQTLDFTPRPVYLPDLVKATGSRDEHPWCPVRALKFYLDQTLNRRGKVKQLFITSTKPHSAAAKGTISRWVISVIRDAYKKHEMVLTGSHVRAHEVRALAASWALYSGSSLSSIIDAIGWKTATTFQSTYLRDVLVSRGSVAVAALQAGRR